MPLPKNEKPKKAKDSPHEKKEEPKKRLTDLENEIKLKQMEKDLSKNSEKPKPDDIEGEDFGEGLAMDDDL